MTTLMRNGRDRRLGKPVKCHARKERVFLVGTRSADHIRASGHSGCIQRPDTWLHPNASPKCQIPLAPRAPSIHGTFLFMGVIGIIIASLVNLFMRSSGLDWMISIIGVGVFAGLTAYDTQRIKGMHDRGDDATSAGRKAVMGALSLYLNFITLFMMMLRLMGGRR